MITKKFDVDFFSDGGALTLGPEDIGTHNDGWTISGRIEEEYYQWVNKFKATHPIFGKVWGDFEKVVYASSEEAFQHFYKHHPPAAWDYRDI